jgi:hypothetical protein
VTSTGNAFKGSGGSAIGPYPSSEGWRAISSCHAELSNLSE